MIGSLVYKHCQSHLEKKKLLERIIKFPGHNSRQCGTYVCRMLPICIYPDELLYTASIHGHHTIMELLETHYKVSGCIYTTRSIISYILYFII